MTKKKVVKVTAPGAAYVEIEAVAQPVIQRTIEQVGNRYAIKSQGQVTAYYNSFEAAKKDLA